MKNHEYRCAPLGDQLAANMGNALANFNSEVFTGPGRIPHRYRELLALAVALTTQCHGCIDVHTRNALALGVTSDEIAEVAYITAAVQAGGATVHGARSIAVSEHNRRTGP